MPNQSGIWTLSQQFQGRGQGLWPTAPGIPTIGTATLVTTTSATVAFTAPTCKGYPATITGYQAISSPGCITATGSSSPLTVSGLTSGTAYTFKVRAQNSSGYGDYSGSSNSVQAKAPGAPTIGTATAGGTLCASVTFTAPACTGVPAGGITNYLVTSTPGCKTASGASSPLTVTGLTCGTAYTFKVKAQNAVGYGPCSAASNSITAKQATCATYTTAGTYSWVAPAGVTSVAILVVGGGGGGDNNTSGGYGGGGGGLAYRNSYSVTPGASYTVVVGAGGVGNASGGQSSFNCSVAVATGGKNRATSGTTSGGAFSAGTGGGSGGSGGNASSFYGAGGGGAAGYTSNGGGGGTGCGSGSNGSNGLGGGGGGGGGGSYYCSGCTVWNTGGAGGGGVGLYGAGASGAGGKANSTGYANPSGGGGGSCGTAGDGNGGSPYVGNGGKYGGGGPGGGWYCSAGNNIRGGGGTGGVGAVRIVWAGGSRGTPSFPSTNVGP